jgi:uncharacterized protein YukE
MAKIATILSGANIQTGSTGAQATPDDFGGSQFRALGQLAQAGENVASTVGQVARQQKEVDDNLWVGQTVEEHKNELNEWMSDPENQGKETYAADFQNKLKEVMSSVKSPSSKAAALYKQRMLSFGSERYESALQLAGRNKLQNNAVLIDSQSAQAIDSYRKSRDIPTVDAGKSLQDSLRDISGQIDTTFGKIAPTVAMKMKDKLYQDAAYGVMRDDPELARTITMQSKTMDEHVRHTILDQIDQAFHSKNIIEIESFNERRKDQFASVLYGNKRDKIDLKEYQSYYPRDKAVALKMRDDALIDTYNKANDVYDRVKSLNAGEQTLELNKYVKNISTDAERDAYQIFHSKVLANIQLQEKNPVSWMQQNNPAVKDALELAMKSTNNQRLQSMKELYDLQLRYQGTPPTGDHASGLTYVLDKETGYQKAVSTNTLDDPRQYLSLPKNSKHLMTQEQATENADKINQGSPNQILDTINQVLASYPGSDYQNIAFNDMVTLPQSGRGIKQEYQLVFLNHDSPNVKSYAGAIGNSDSVKALNSEKRGDFEKALNSNATWNAFAHSMLGDNFQRVDEIAGFKKGILQYAMAHHSQSGDSPEASIKAATGEIINQKLGFAHINGQTMMILRDRGDGKPPRNDEEINAMGMRLQLALQHVDPREIKQDDGHGRNLFPTLALAGTDMQKMQAIRDAITMNGYFQTGPDGKSVSLYYHDGMNHFEVRDKSNNAFEIALDDVDHPGTEREDLTEVSRATPFGKPSHVSYPLLERTPASKTWGMFGGLNTITNWPTSTEIIKKVPR